MQRHFGSGDQKCQKVSIRGCKQSRGDKTAIELFLREIRGWEASLRRRFDDG